LHFAVASYDEYVTVTMEFISDAESTAQSFRTRSVTGKNFISSNDQPGHSRYVQRVSWTVVVHQTSASSMLYRAVDKTSGFKASHALGNSDSAVSADVDLDQTRLYCNYSHHASIAVFIWRPQNGQHFRTGP